MPFGKEVRIVLLICPLPSLMLGSLYGYPFSSNVYACILKIVPFYGYVFNKITGMLINSVNKSFYLYGYQLIQILVIVLLHLQMLHQILTK